MPTVVLVRHGETDWNRERRAQGWAPTALNDRGHEQARALADHLAGVGIDRLVASDLRRARETTRYVARALPGVEPTFDPAWRERNFGDMQGLDYEALFGEFPEYEVSSVGIEALRTRPPNGERLLDLRERVLDGWDSLLDGLGDDETAVVVTHGGPIYAVLGHVKRWPLTRSIVEQSVANCSISEIAVEQDEVTVVREGGVEHLGDGL